MRNNKKLFASVLAGILALIMLVSLLVTALPVPRVSAEKSASQIQSEISALEREKAALDAQIDSLQAKIDANMSEIEKIVAEKDVIDQEISLLHDKMNNINDQIAAHSTMIAEKQAELEESQAQLEELKLQYKDRIRAMEENGTLTYWEVIFQANDFADLLDRLNMVEEIERADNQRLEEIRVAAEKVEATKAELEVKKVRLEETRTELDNTGKELEEKQKETDKLLQDLLAKGAEYDKYIEEQEAKADALRDQIDEREGKLDEMEKAEFDKWLETQKPANGNGSSTGSNNVGGQTWILPINYTAFTSPFGYRVHPISGTWKMHNGVDLAAPTGTPIYATRSGVVSYRGWWGSGGNTIAINHQDGYLTRYLHMNSFAVSNGEWVAAGQVIGYCGTTGGSTGPHLHFEIEYNGKYVNPAEYINI